MTAAMLLAAALVPAGCASAPPRPVQLRLLRFLGTSDSAEREERSAGTEWLRYLSRLNLPPSAPPKKRAAAAPKKAQG